MVRTAGLFLLAVVLVTALVLLADEGRREDLIQFRDASLAILQVAGIMLLFLFVAGLVAWLSQPMGMTFENATGDQDVDGPVLAQSLAVELQRIEAVHAAEAKAGKHKSYVRSINLQPAVLSRRDIMAASMRVPLASSGKADAVAAIGTVDVVGASLPLGPMLMAVKQLWPLPRPGVKVTGRLTRRDEALALAVRVQRSRKTPPREFTVIAPAGASWHSLVAAAGTRIAYELLPAENGTSRPGFDHLTQALEHYHEFKQTGDLATLHAAVAAADHIPAGDERVWHVRGLIYNLGVCCLGKRELPTAEKLLLRVRRTDLDDVAVCNALGMLYFEQRRFVEASETFLRATDLTRSDLWDPRPDGDWDIAAWNGLGNTYVELADYVKAIDAYQQAIERRPEAVAPHYGLGNAYLQQHQWDAAAHEYRQANAIDPKWAHPYFGLGNLKTRRGKYEEARVYHQNALRLDDSFAQAWNGLGEAEAALRHFPDALAAHEKALELRENDPYTLCSLGATYLLQGDRNKAREVLEQALDIDASAAYVWKTLGRLYLSSHEPRAADSAFQEALRRNPRDAAAWDGRAQAVRALDGGSEAEVEHLRRATDENPEEPWGWNQLGDAHRRAGAYRDSCDAHRRALDCDPGNSYAFDGIGQAQLALGELTAARKAFEKALRVNPNDAFAPHGIAATRMVSGDYVGAIEADRRALRIDDNALYARNGLGDAYERLRRYDEAEGHFRATVERAGDDIAAAAYAHAGMARIALARRQPEAALAAVRRGREAQPSQTYPLVTLGDIHLSQGAHQEAVEAYREALVHDPKTAAAWDGLGRAYVWQGDYATAGEIYRQAMEACPHDWRLLTGTADVMLRSMCDHHQDDFEDAWKQYDAVVHQEPVLSIAAQVRLAAIAAHRGDRDVAKLYAEGAVENFSLCWVHRPLPDHDLIELHALARLLHGDAENALALVCKACEERPDGGQFDSVRAGAYALLSDDLVPRFAEFAALVFRAPGDVERDAQLAD